MWVLIAVSSMNTSFAGSGEGCAISHFEFFIGEGWPIMPDPSDAPPG